MQQGLKVFIVDDDPLSRLVTIEALADGPHELREFAGGAELLAATETPDVILMDIEMPGMDGIAACRALRAAGNDHSLVVFISAHDDIETKLATYAAGGSDFLVKPFDPLELEQKLRVAGDFLARRDELAHQARFAQQAAFAAMSSMGEIGVVLQFLRASFSCRNCEEVVQRLFEAVRQYELEALAEFRVSCLSKSYSSRGEATPLEKSILGHARGMDRIFQFHDRLVINYPTVTLLVLNLPADAERVGRLRDDLAILVEGAEARLAGFETESRRQTQADAVVRIADDLAATLEEIERSEAEQRVQAMVIRAEYLRDLTNAFVHLGLSEDQETALTRLAQDAHARLDALVDAGSHVSERLHQAALRLRDACGH